MGFKGRSLFKFIIRGHFLLERNTPNSADVTPYLQKRTNNGDGSGPTMDQPTMGTVLVDMKNRARETEGMSALDIFQDNRY
jgi:hypothetical protein